MSEKLELRFQYVEGSATVDVGFLQALPDMKLEPPVRDSILRGTVIISGTAAATVTALASIIKSWLATRRTKIEIANIKTGKKITYEGPGLKEETVEIADKLRGLVDESGTTIQIHAMRLDVGRIN